MARLNAFFDFFRQDRPYIDLDPSKWPTDWSVVQFTAYPRYDRVALSEPSPDNEISLRKTMMNRASNREFSKAPLSLGEISNILFYSCGITRPSKEVQRTRRAQPSGGGLYPIEVYVGIQKESGELGKGIYHYNVLEHCLEKLPVNTKLLNQLSVYPWVHDAALVLLFTFIEDRTKSKYGNFGYKLGLIEAGHIGQNVYLNCTAMDLKCCSLGGVNEENAHALLNIDGISEVVFYGIAIGK